MRRRGLRWLLDNEDAAAADDDDEDAAAAADDDDAAAAAAVLGRSAIGTSSSSTTTTSARTALREATESREAAAAAAAAADGVEDASLARDFNGNAAPPPRLLLFSLVSSQPLPSLSSSSFITRLRFTALPPSDPPLCFARISNGDNGDASFFGCSFRISRLFFSADRCCLPFRFFRSSARSSLPAGCIGITKQVCSSEYGDWCFA